MNPLTGMLSVPDANCAEDADSVTAEGSAESTCSYIELFSAAVFGAFSSDKALCLSELSTGKTHSLGIQITFPPM